MSSLRITYHGRTAKPIRGFPRKAGITAWHGITVVFRWVIAMRKKQIPWFFNRIRCGLTARNGEPSTRLV